MVVLCFSTWRWLNPSEIEQLPINIAEVKRERVPNCFRESCEIRSGIFQIWPDVEILKTLKTLDDDCLENLCLLCQDSERFAKQNAFEENDCISEIFRAAKDYHFKQLSRLPKLTLFYNSGEAELTEWQREDLDAFFKGFRGLMNEKGILILGRASKGGSDVSNQRLSQERATNIKLLLDDLLRGNFKSNYIYFGSKPPQLTVEDAKLFAIEKSAYRSVDVSGSIQPDFSLRLNQSVMVVIYDLEDGVFGRSDEI